MKPPPCSSQLRSHSRTGHDSAFGSGVIGVKELIRNSLTRGPETAFGEASDLDSVQLVGDSSPTLSGGSGRIVGKDSGRLGRHSGLSFRVNPDASKAAKRTD